MTVCPNNWILIKFRLALEEIVKKSIMHNSSFFQDFYLLADYLIVFTDIECIILLNLDFSNSYDTVFKEFVLCLN